MKQFCFVVFFSVCSVTLAAPYTLTISTNGNGSVARNPTNSVYPQNSVVTLTALPASGWFFSSWSGDISGLLNPTNVLMNTNKVITANFLPAPTYTLTVGVSGSGSVSPTGGTYPSNTLVSVTATASNGWVFQQWTGDASGSANPLDVVINSDKAITAVFAPTNCSGDGDLVAWLQFEGNGSDSVGSNNAVLFGNPVFTTGVVGQALRLDGSDDSARIPASPTLNVGQESGFTIALWIKPDSVSSLQPIVEWNNGAGTIGVHLWLSVDRAVPNDSIGALFANVVDASGISHAMWTDPNLLSIGTYQHVALTYDRASGIAALYHNGVLTRQTNFGSFTPSTAMNLDFGMRASGPVAGPRFRGDMDEFTLYARALSSQQVETIYNGGSLLDCSPRIVRHPQDVFSDIGATATFSVEATGALPLEYQWYYNTQLLAGATSSTLELSNVQSNHVGLYSVVVSNAFGTATSDTARLIISEGCNSNALTSCTDAALRAAIERGGTVRFCCNGTITLTNTIEVTRDVTLDASGAAVVISGGASVRLFDVSTNVMFAVSNLPLINGRFTGDDTFARQGGAAIRNVGGAVQLTSCLLSNNIAINGSGGAIASYGGSLTITNSSLVNNLARSTLPSFWPNGQGGAIWIAENGMLRVSDSLMASNSAVSDSGAESTAQVAGGALVVLQGTALVTRVRFFTNGIVGGFTPSGSIAEAGGGAIRSYQDLTVIDCSFSGNYVQAGGGLTVDAPGGFGGAIDHSGGNATLVGTTFFGNTCRGGNGLSVPPVAGYAGTDARGGAIRNFGGSLMATNCTFYGNAAIGGNAGFGPPGSPAGNAYGGAIYGAYGSVVLVNVTIATNTANRIPPSGTGGGLSFGANIANLTNTPFTVRNCLIAYSGTNASVWGTITDDGYNMCSDGSANFNSGSSFNFTDPKLGSLANNGGQTRTMALQPDSPAIDWAPSSDAPPTDQRGVPRPVSSGVDLGAFEVGPFFIHVNGQHETNTFNLFFDGEAGLSYRIERSPDLEVWTTQEVIAVISTNGVVSRNYPMTEPFRFYRVALNP